MNKLKNNKGNISPINFIIFAFIAITLISYLGGFYHIVAQRHALARCANHVARVAGRQGGFASSKPSDWDDYVSYLTTSQIISYVKETMEIAGIESWDIYINGNSIYANMNMDYSNDIEVEMVMKYDWGLFSPAHNGASGTKEYRVKRTAKSEKFLRYKNEVQYDKT